MMGGMVVGVIVVDVDTLKLGTIIKVMLLIAIVP